MIIICTHLLQKNFFMPIKVYCIFWNFYLVLFIIFRGIKYIKTTWHHITHKILTKSSQKFRTTTFHCFQQQLKHVLQYHCGQWDLTEYIILAGLCVSHVWVMCMHQCAHKIHAYKHTSKDTKVKKIKKSNNTWVNYRKQLLIRFKIIHADRWWHLEKESQAYIYLKNKSNKRQCAA